MGIDAGTKVFIGTWVEECETHETVTKYNEDTGKPYEITVPTTLYKIGSFSFKELEDIEMKTEDFIELIHDYHDDAFWVGKTLSNLDFKNGDSEDSYSLEFIKQNWKTTAKELHELFNVNEDEIELWIVGGMY